MIKLSKNEKRALARILAAAVMLVLAALAPVDGVLKACVFLVPYLFVGWDVLYSAFRGVIRGQVFDENFLMALATVGAFLTAEYSEAVFVMLFYRVGELFESAAVSRSRASVAELMDIMPDHANVERVGELISLDPYEVEVGEVIVVKPGERVPLDGRVIEGSTALDSSALTGESVPRDVTVGDEVISGCVNLRGLIRVEVTKACDESTVTRILELVESSAEKKARSESFITRFARYYTPCVVIAAVLLTLIPPLFTGEWGVWFHRALIFLVVSCPCALVISVPLSFFGGIGGASRCGILVKGSNYLEQLAAVDTVVFDKTGTLTRGSFSVTALHPAPEVTESELIELAAAAESYSDHPVSISLRAYCGEMPALSVSDVEEIAGHGVFALVGGRRVAVGNARLMAREGLEAPDCELPGTVIHVAAEGAYIGHIVIADEAKPGSAAALESLRQLGVRRCIMLTGDAEDVAEKVARELRVDEYHAGLLPADKVEWTERFLEGNNGSLAFVGDGLNDAPVLMRADVGIAMGALGSDAAIEAADIVLLDDDPQKVATAVKIARKTMRIVRQNVVFALGVKFLVLALGAFGAANMWAAVFADVGVSVIAITNATRALNAGKK